MSDNSSGSPELNYEEEQEYDDIYSIEKGRHAIVKVFRDSYKKSGRNFVVEIQKKTIEGYEVKFLKRQIASNRFIVSDESEALVLFNEVIMALPKPTKDQRVRFKNMLYFNMDLSTYNLH